MLSSLEEFDQAAHINIACSSCHQCPRSSRHHLLFDDTPDKNKCEATTINASVKFPEAYHQQGGIRGGLYSLYST